MNRDRKHSWQGLRRVVQRLPSCFPIPICDGRSFRAATTKTVARLSIAGLCIAGVSLSAILAADIPVTTVNDSGAGSLRQGLSAALSGDRLVFATTLDGQTLVNGAAIVPSAPVILHDATPITLIDSHAWTIAAPLAVDWGGSLVLNGIISNGTSTGSLVNNGLGTLILSGANTFTGGVTTNGGTIETLNNAALGTGTFTVTATAGPPTLELGSGITLSNKISLQTTLTVDTVLGGAGTLSGVISGTNATDSLTTTGGGTLTLSGANTFLGGVFVTNASTLNIQNSTSLGTGTLSNAANLTLNLASGLTVANPISLGSNMTVGVTTGSTTLSGSITETAVSQLTKTGAGTLILTGANSYTGGTIISQGTLQGDSTSLTGNISNGGSLIINQTSDGTYAGAISGAGDITKEGAGTLILTGASGLTGTTTITEGGLQVMGTLGGPVVLDSSTTLTGTGTVGSVTNAGVVQPGTTSIGTLNVNGNYTQTTGTTEIKFNSTGNTPGVNNDVVNVTGQATLAGTLQVQGIGGGTFVPGTQYTIINAPGGVSGQFTEARTNLPMFRVNVTYDANDVMFALQQTTSLAAAATTSNQLNVGTAMDNIAMTSTGALYTMIGDVGVLPVAQQQQALNQLSGEIYGNLQNLGLEIGNQFQQRIINTLVSNVGFLAGEQQDSSPDSGIRGQSNTWPRSRSWVQGYGFGGNFRGDGNAGSLGFGQGGLMLGLEPWADDLVRVGLVVGNSYGAFSDSFGGGGNINSYQFGAYSLADNEYSYLLGSANYGYNRYFSHRDISISGASQQQLNGDFAGNQIGANLEYGWKLGIRSLHIQPLVGLQYLYLCQQGFEESGGPAALDVARSRANSLRANIGVRAALDPFEGPGGTVWTPFTNVRFVGDTLDNNRVINASFVGAPVGGSFSSQGTRIGQTYGFLGQGLEIRVSDVWSYYGGAELTANERLVIGTGSLGAVAVW